MTPDIEWYGKISLENNITPRCPFASTAQCPRYFLSLALLKETGATAMDESEFQRIKAYWDQRSGSMSKINEQDPSVYASHNDAGQEKCSGITNFCPEITYERFGLFASALHDYADEIDRDNAHQWLGKINAALSDPRWRWNSVTPMHYSVCPLYAPLKFGRLTIDGPDNSARLTIGPSWMSFSFAFSGHELIKSIRTVKTKLFDWIASRRRP